MRPNETFSSQVDSLGDSENATKRSIFKPSGFTWRLGKCDQAKHSQAKWSHLATRKMRPNETFPSEVESLGDSGNVAKRIIFKRSGFTWRLRRGHGLASSARPSPFRRTLRHLARAPGAADTGCEKGQPSQHGRPGWWFLACGN